MKNGMCFQKAISCSIVDTVTLPQCPCSILTHFKSMNECNIEWAPNKQSLPRPIRTHRHQNTKWMHTVIATYLFIAIQIGQSTRFCVFYIHHKYMIIGRINGLHRRKGSLDRQIYGHSLKESLYVEAARKGLNFEIHKTFKFKIVIEIRGHTQQQQAENQNATKPVLGRAESSRLRE